MRWFPLFCALAFVSAISPVLADDAPPIKIGTILILTGEGASWGTAAKNGVDLAIEHINRDGGVLGRKLQALHEDDQGKPSNTISAFHRLTSVENIQMIIGPTWGMLGLPLIQHADQKKVIMISPSLGLAKFNESSPYLFNTWPHDFVLSEQLAEYVFQKGHRRVAVVGAEEAWVKEQTQAFQHKFTALGGQVSFVSEPILGTIDVKPIATKIRANPNIDAIVSTTDGVIIGSLVAKSLRELGSKTPVYSITLDQAAIDVAQGGLDGAEFLTFLTPRPEFVKEYTAKFKTQIDIGADSAYDAVQLLAKAIRDAGTTDPTTVAKRLESVRSYSGMSGELVSDGKRGFTKPFAIKTIVNGKPQ